MMLGWPEEGMELGANGTTTGWPSQAAEKALFLVRFLFPMKLFAC
jgi:hypothetical protein